MTIRIALHYIHRSYDTVLSVCPTPSRKESLGETVIIKVTSSPLRDNGKKINTRWSIRRKRRRSTRRIDRPYFSVPSYYTTHSVLVTVFRFSLSSCPSILDPLRSSVRSSSPFVSIESRSKVYAMLPSTTGLHSFLFRSCVSSSDRRIVVSPRRTTLYS